MKICIFCIISTTINSFNYLHLILEIHTINYVNKPGQIIGHSSNFNTLKIAEEKFIENWDF